MSYRADLDGARRYARLVPANPPVVPADTSPEVWREQMAVVRGLSPQRRLELWTELNGQLAAMETAAIARQCPDADPAELRVEVIRRRFGDDLAEWCRPTIMRALAAAHSR